MRVMLIAFLFLASGWLNASTANGLKTFNYFEDPSSSMSAQDVASQDFTLVSGNVFNYGFSDSTFWIKFDLKGLTKEDLFLSILPANLVSTDAFEWDGQTWRRMDRDNPTLGINTIFKKAHEIYKIDTRENNETILLKINSKNTVIAILYLQNKTELINQTIEIVTRLTVFLVLLSIFCLVLLVTGIYKKDIFFLAVLLWSLQLGIARLLLGGMIFPSYFFSGASVFLTLTAVGLPLTISLFILALFQTHAIRGKLKSCSVGLTFIAIAMLIYYFFSLTFLSQKILTYWSLVPIFFLIIVPCIPYVFKRLGIALATCIFLLGTIVLIFRSTQLGLMPTAFNSILSPSMHVPFLVLFIVAALSKIKRAQEQSGLIQKNSLIKAQQETEKEKLRQVQQHKFMLMLTHELKNSLSVIRFYIQVAKAQQEFSTLAEQSVNDMDAIIERCSQLDQLEREEIKLNFKPVDLNELTTQLVSQNSQKHRIQFEYQSSKRVLQTDVILLRTIIANLLDNALKYSPPASRITLSIRHTTDELRQSNKIQGLTVTIQNSVAAQDVPDKDLIFTKYYRGTMANRVSGSGLGLYLVQSMSQLLGAELSFSCHDDYVTFKIWIPS
ncbi:MAG: 7TM-DISM domain-containing protein [Sheuella sp.]|nr:7TM-DISM domain-containing protein [Sheuella sp.]